MALAATRTNPLRLRSRAQSTDRAMTRAAAAASASAVMAMEDEPRTPWSSTSSGFRDPLVVRREELEARARSVPPPPKVVAGKPRAPVGQLVAFFDKS